MSQLCVLPIYRALDASGNPISGAKLYFYLTGTTTGHNVYTTSALSTAHANPVVADSGGFFAKIYLDPTITYRAILKTAADVTLIDIDPITPFSAASIAFLQSGTGAQAETVQSAIRRLPISPEQFGAIGDGTADDSVALQNSVGAAASTKRSLVLSATYKITTPIVLPSNVKIFAGIGGATITTGIANISLFSCSGKSGIEIRGIKFIQTNAGTNAYTGGVVLDGCTNCIVESCEFVGMQWAGIYLSEANYNRIGRNYFHDFLGSNQDSADICIYRTSSFNEIFSNRCEGGNWHGIFAQDPYESAQPKRNRIYDNYVAGHKCYGIVVYIPGVGAIIEPPSLGTPIDTFNKVIATL